MPLTPDITIKRGDTGKVLSGQFLDANDQAINLSSSTARKVFMKNTSTGALQINGATFTFSDATTGKWSYTCAQNDVAVAGWFQLEFEVTRPANVDSFPTDPLKPYLLVLIESDLG